MCNDQSVFRVEACDFCFLQIDRYLFILRYVQAVVESVTL